MVLACGLATVDVVQRVERLPGPDEKVTALGTTVEAGGPALNAAVTAALLGVSVRLVSAVGSSGLAPVVRDDCAGHGVALVDTAASGFALPVSSVLVTEDTGERAVVSRNASGVVEWAVPEDDALTALLEDVAVVLVDGHHLPVCLAVARAARAAGIPVVLDGGSWKEGLGELLGFVDVLVASGDFRSPGGDSLRDLRALGPRWVARSAGAGPVSWQGADGSSGEVAVPQVVVVDTLGAGDVLHGAFVADLARRGTGDLPASLAAAVEVATRSVTAVGARGWADWNDDSGEVHG